MSTNYLTADEARDYIGRQFTDSTGVLEDIVTAASRAVDRHCGRHFYSVGTQASPVARYFDATTPNLLRLGTYNDLTTLVTLKSDDDGSGTYETTWSATNYQLCPVGAASRAPVAEPFTEIRLLNSYDFEMHVTSGRTGLIEVSGVWGWPAVPVDIKQATRLIVHEYAKLQDAPFGMLGSAEFGMSRIPPQKQRHVRELLAPFVHPDHVGIG